MRTSKFTNVSFLRISSRSVMVSEQIMQNLISRVISLFQLLNNSPYVLYIVVTLCFLILVILQVRKVRSQNRKRRFLLIETHQQNLLKKNESSDYAITSEGEILDLTKMINRQIIEIRWILFFLPLFFFSILLVILFSPLFWPIPFIGLIGVFIVTILGATRMLKYGNTRSYLHGKELLREMNLNERITNSQLEKTNLTNQVKLDNFFDYLSCETRLKLDDRVSSTWTLYIGLRAIKTFEQTLKSKLFQLDKKGVKSSRELREYFSKDIEKITDFFFNNEKQSLFCIESWENYLIGHIRFAIHEPQRVTEERRKWLMKAFELLEAFSTKLLQYLQISN
jgi:hypothetical protein